MSHGGGGANNHLVGTGLPDVIFGDPYTAGTSLYGDAGAGGSTLAGDAIFMVDRARGGDDRLYRLTVEMTVERSFPPGGARGRGVKPRQPLGRREGSLRPGRVPARVFCSKGEARASRREMVGPTGFEPATSCPPDKRATSLRHGPKPCASANRRA